MTHTLTAPGEPARTIHCLCALLRPTAGSGGTGPGGRGSGKELQGHSRPVRRTGCPRTRERTCIQRRSTAADRQPSTCLDARPWAVVRHHVAPSAPCSPGRSAAVAGDGAGSKRAKAESLGVRLATPDAFAALVADYLERGRSSGWSPMEPSAERRPPSARHRPTAPGRPPPSSRGFRVLADPRHEAAGGSRSQPGSTGVGLRPPETSPFR